MLESRCLKPPAWSGMVLLCALFALGIGVFSQWPLYHHLDPGEGLVKLSFSLAGQRIAPCRLRGDDELARLPPNMRNLEKCERERSPVRVEVDIDGRPAFRHVAAPSGLSRDGASSVHQRLIVPAGAHRLAVRLKDSPGAGVFEHQREVIVTLAPAQVLVIDFDPTHGGITIR